MNKIERSQEYYQLLIDKFEKSGRSPRQKQVYEEIKALVGTCSSLEEIQSKMKEQGYYEKPGQALFLDKMASLRDAAKDNDFPEVAETYQQKFSEVEQDYSQAFATGYEQEVSRKLHKRGQIVGAINELFQLYLQFLARNDYESPGDLEQKVNKVAHEMHGYSSSMEEALDTKYYRDHVGLSDAEYENFKSWALGIKSKGAASFYDPNSCEEEFNAIWSTIKQHKDKIKEIGKSEGARSKRKVYMALPPQHEGGDYSFVEPREEGR